VTQTVFRCNGAVQEVPGIQEHICFTSSFNARFENKLSRDIILFVTLLREAVFFIPHPPQLPLSSSLHPALVIRWFSSQS